MQEAFRTVRQNIRLLAVVSALAASAIWCVGRVMPRPDTVLRVGIYQFPPYLLERADGSADGAAVAILNEAARRLGIRLRWSIEKEGPDLALAAGKVDLWPLLDGTASRDGTMHVSPPWMVSEFVLLTLKSSGAMTLEQAAGKRVAYLGGPVTEAMASKYLKGIQPLRRSTSEAAMRAVCTGEADAAFIDSRFAQSILMDRPAGCGNSGLQYTLARPAVLPLGVASTLKHARTADLLAEEILQMGFDGTLPKILAQWSIIDTHDTEALTALGKLKVYSHLFVYVIAGMVLLLSLLGVFAHRLHSAKEIASRAVQVKATLLTNLSHEIRTPMNGVMGMTNLLFTTNLTDEQREYAEAAQSSAESLLEMLNNILDYARMDQGRLQFESVDFDLHGLLEDVAEHFGPHTGRKRLELACLIAPETPQIVTGDPVRLRQVLSNLMSNAVKFTDRGEIFLSSKVVSEEAGGVVLQIEVSDTGIGITEEDRPKLFRSFGQLDAPGNRSHSGAGLGLAICKQIVAGGGGYIDYHSKLGVGSSFWVVMRFGRPEYNLPPVQADPRLAGRSVLIVSGSETIRRMILIHCRALNMKALEGTSVGHALELLQQMPFDLIVADGLAPDASRLAELKIPSTKLILLSSFSGNPYSQTSMDGADETRADAILPKPVRQSHFSHVVREVFARVPVETDSPALSTRL